MIKDLQSLRELIAYAKSQKIQGFRVGDVEVTFSPFAFTDEATFDDTIPTAKTEEKNTSKTLVDTLEPSAEDEELLFWSSKG